VAYAGGLKYSCSFGARAGLLVLFLGACASQSLKATESRPPDVTPPEIDAGGDPVPAEAGPDGTAAPTSTVRIVAANTTSGASTSYDPIESIRIFQGLHPDVVLLQEFKYGSATPDDLKSFVTTAFGATYNYYREAAGDIPNGIVSRYPIVASGTWDDPNVDNRGFAWAKIEIPKASHPLWAVSIHLLTTSASNRGEEATALVAKIKETVPAGDYVVIGGDLNTSVRSEPCIETLSQVVVTTAPYPDDGAGNNNTNAPRTKPHDWLLSSASLSALAAPVKIGARSFPSGLVFDSRVYTPLADVAPIIATDSAAPNMQHMPVVRDFAFPR
jgi:endonuclease/exonuclease/phosphatase family metal-dependent hydrolase